MLIEHFYMVISVENVRIRSSGMVGGIERQHRVSSLSAVGMGLDSRKRSLLICNSAAVRHLDNHTCLLIRIVALSKCFGCLL